MRILLVDLDGVLRLWPVSVDHAIEARFRLPPGSIHAAAFADERLRPAITGRITDAEWRAATADALEAAHPQGDAGAAVRAWSESPGQLAEECVELIRRCRARARVVLATNATSRLDQDLRALGIEDAFHVVANSAVIGHAKPDPRFYRAAVSLAGAPGAEVFVVDDKRANVEAAEALGMAGHVHASSEGLRRSLERWGLLVPG